MYGKIKNTKSGTITMGHPRSRHNTGSKSAAYNRKVRKSVQLSTGDRKRLKNVI